MNVEIEATYENGILRLDRPLPLGQGQRLRVTVHLPASHAQQSAGLIPWSGSVEDLEYLAESPENSPWEKP
jgi:predicted DNA-binding antitoxin AbrB/MazE fold protein